jgi:hypothetical protein
VFSLPESRQLARLQANVEKAGIFVVGQIALPQNAAEITGDLSYQIYDGVRYLCYNFDCEKVAQIFGKEMGSKSIGGMIQEIATEFKLNNSNFTASAPSTLYVHVEEMFPIDIAGYDYLVRLDDEVGNLRIRLNIEENALHISDEKRLKETIFVDLKTPIYEALAARYGTLSAYRNVLPGEVLTFEVKGEKYAVKLTLESLSMKNPEYQGSKKEYFYVHGNALVKEL